MNPRFPPHVSIFEEENIPHRLTSRYSAVSYAFAVKGFCALSWAFEVLSWLVRELFHGCTFHWPVYALQRQISHLSTPPPNRLFVISQILGDTWPDPTRVSRRVEPGNEVEPVAFFDILVAVIRPRCYDDSPLARRTPLYRRTQLLSRVHLSVNFKKTWSVIAIRLF